MIRRRACRAAAKSTMSPRHGTLRDRTSMNLHQPADRQADKLTADELATERLAVEKFAVGQSVPRSEDPMLLRGQGRYTDDVSLPGQAYAVMVRSRIAHGIIRAHRCGRRADHARRTRRLYRGRSESLRAAQMHRAVQKSRRLADEEAVARRAGDGQGALRRRSGRLRRRRDRARRQGCGRSGRPRYRSRCRP